MNAEVAGLRELAPIHDRLERLLADLGAAIAAGQQAAIAQLRKDFDHEILMHFDAEERIMIPTIARLSERDARVIVLEHRHLIRRWIDICASIDRSVATAAGVRAFAEELRVHAENEDRVLDRLGHGLGAARSDG